MRQNLAAAFQDAIRQAQAMLDTTVAMTVDAGGPPPQPSDPDTLDPDGGQIVWLPVTYSNVAERIYLTLPKTLLARIDNATTNRSAFFTELARERLGG